MKTSKYFEVQIHECGGVRPRRKESSAISN